MKKFIHENWPKIVVVVIAIILISLSLNLIQTRQVPTSTPDLTTEKSQNTQLANPASVNCESHGGKLSIVDKPEGQVGMCTLSDGTICEEWAYFRGDCP